MGAGITDLGPQVVALPSLQAAGQTSGMFASLSGTVIGTTVDLINANTYCNLWVQGVGSVVLSGAIVLQIQQSDSTASGTFTDPTLGMLSGDLTSVVTSGGLVTLNANASGGVWGGFTSGQSYLSGFLGFAGFSRGGRYARVNFHANSTGIANINAGFIAQQKVVGSGGGFTFAPGSGSVNV